MRILRSPEGRLALIALGVLVLMTALNGERFLLPQNLTSMAFQFPEFAILALAMTVAMLTGGIDLSVVGAANLSAVIAATVMSSFAGDGSGLGIVLAASVLALLVGLAAGLVNGVMVAVLGLPPAASWLGNAAPFGIPMPLIVFALLALLVGLILQRTPFGLKTRLFGTNPLAARYAAMDVRATLLKVYALCGTFSAVSGLIVMSRANSAKADYGSSYLLLAVLIAVLGGVNPYGGTGRVIGVVIAVVTMQMLSSGLNLLGVTNFAREMIWGALLIAVMLLNTLADRSTR